MHPAHIFQHMSRQRPLLPKMLLLWSLVQCLIGCQYSEEGPPAPITPQELYRLMHEWYLWRNTLPTGLLPEDYQEAAPLLEALRYRPIDRWSGLSNSEAYKAYYASGSTNSGGHGIQMSIRADGRVFLSLVYPNTQAWTQGLRRGTEVLAINGTSVQGMSAQQLNTLLGPSIIGTRNTLQVRQQGVVRSLQLQKEAVYVSSLLSQRVLFLPDSTPVGYCCIKTFISPTKQQLAQAFASFKAQGVHELVVDLRYNGGGLIDVARQLCGLIAPETSAGKPLFLYAHNDRRSPFRDSSQPMVLQPEGLRLQRVFFLTGPGTASASELAINALRPYMEVHVIGGRTYGKPVGAYGFERGGSILSVISFQLMNAQKEGEYFTGLQPSYATADDPSYDWGDPEEPMLGAALYYMEKARYPGRATRSTPPYTTTWQEQETQERAWQTACIFPEQP